MDEIIIISDDDEEIELIVDREHKQTQIEDALQFAYKHLYRDEPSEESSNSEGERRYKIENPNEETLQPKTRLPRSPGAKSSDDEIFTVFEISVLDIPPKYDFIADSSTGSPENELKSDLETTSKTASHKETETFETPRKFKSTKRKPTILFPEVYSKPTTSKNTCPHTKDSEMSSGVSERTPICNLTLKNIDFDEEIIPGEWLSKTEITLSKIPRPKSSAVKCPQFDTNNCTTEQEDEDCIATKTISIENTNEELDPNISTHPSKTKPEEITNPKTRPLPKFDEESCPILDRLFFSDEPKKKPIKHENTSLHILKKPLKVSDEPAATSTPLSVPQNMEQSLRMLEECSVIFQEIDSSLFNVSLRQNELCKSSSNESAKYDFTNKTARSYESGITNLNNDYAVFASKIFEKVYLTKIENVLNAKELRSGVFQYNNINFITVKLNGYVRSLDYKDGECIFLLYDDTGRIEIRYRSSKEQLDNKYNMEEFKISKDDLKKLYDPKKIYDRDDPELPFYDAKKEEDLLKMVSLLLWKKFSVRNRQFPTHTEINWGTKLTVIGRVWRFKRNDEPDPTTIIYPWNIKLQSSESESVLHHIKMMTQKYRRDATKYFKNLN